MTAIDFTLSTIAAAHETRTTDKSFRALMEDISSPKWATQVAAVRDAYSRGGKDAAAEPKKKLPGILFSGTFSKRAASALVKHSGLICVDLDELGDQLDAIFEHIAVEPHTLAAFRSPTGTGLKVIFRCDPSRPHAESYEAAEHHVLEHFGLAIDKACKDVCRICFVSHDPAIFAADDAEPLPYPPKPSEFKPSGLNPSTGLELTPGDDYDQRGDLFGLLLKHGWTKSGQQGWIRPGKTAGLSATFDKVPGRFFVFSSSTEFQANHTYRPWHVYAILEHGGDFSAAAGALGASGFGHQRKPPQRERLDRVAGPEIENFDDVPPVPVTGLVGRPLGTFNLPGHGDPSILIGNRWLSRGDIAILASTSGMGKSSLSIQAAVTWGLGRKLFDGFKPHRPLKSLIFQAEDGDGDIAEVRLSMEFAMKLTVGERVQVNQNVIIVTDRIHRGLSFRAELKRQIDLHSPDIVWVNPLLAFIGGDVNDSTDVGAFLREQLNSLNEPARFAYVIVHHTAKPPKEKKERQWNEVMYEMAGSADLTNAARAILCLQATNEEGEFRFIAAKRGPRAGLTHLVPGTVNPELKFEVSTSTITLRHSKERMVVLADGSVQAPATGVTGQELPVIHWERCDDRADEIKAPAGRPSKYKMSDFMAHVPQGVGKAMPAAQIWKRVRTESGISESGFKDLIARAAKDGSVYRVSDVRGPVFYV